MCGLTVFINPKITAHTAEAMFRMGAARGPDASVLLYESSSMWIGFHRLAINGLDERSNQPLRLGSRYLVCNGEIYNSAELYAQMQVTPNTGSDCEVLLHLVERYGIDAALQMIDASEFAFVLYDATTNEVVAARDPYGVRPLFKCVAATGMVVFGSELKTLMTPNAQYSAVLPGTYQRLREGVWSTTTYSALPCPAPLLLPVDPRQVVRGALYQAVMKRVRNTERPMACLLSGGLDSSTIAALVVQCRNELGIAEALETYSIGMEGGEDLRYASIMAAHLGTKHTTVIVDEAGFVQAIPKVVHAIESYDTTTVRASVGNWLVAQYVAKQSQAKVLFNGDGADELAGGYLYFRYAPDAAAKDAECRRLLGDIHCFDALRSDKSIASHGLEPRTPFLDRHFVQAYMALPAAVRFPEGGMEKQLLREAVADLLPPEIAWRTKEAFSDGVSHQNRSWFEVIQESLPSSVHADFRNSRSYATKHWVNPPQTAEQYYYRVLYNQYYSECGGTIPYFWMPRFVNAPDCSARTLPKNLR
jgi:asparagine synthase (glutamine-hydrolysing)